MTDLFLPYGKHNLDEQDINSVVNVLRSDFLTQGPVVPEFEKKVSSKLGSSYAVASNSATSSLHVACLSLGLQQGDWLWTSPLSFNASANVGLLCGAYVDFVDVDSCTGLMSIDALKGKLDKARELNKLPKVIIPVHLAGASCDMKSIKSLSDEYGFSIVEDASHAFGAKYQGRYVGSCQYSDICVFSLHPVKIITSGEGGMALTNSKKLETKMRAYCSHGIVKDPSLFLSDETPYWSSEQQYLGYNYRMSDIHAALGFSQLDKLDSIVLERRNLRQLYLPYLERLPVSVPSIPADSSSSVHIMPILLDTSLAKFYSDIFAYMRSVNIGVQLHYKPIHIHPYYFDLGFRKGNFPNAELYASRALTLPLYCGLQQEDLLRVVDNLSTAISIFLKTS